MTFDGGFRDTIALPVCDDGVVSFERNFLGLRDLRISEIDICRLDNFPFVIIGDPGLLSGVITKELQSCCCSDGHGGGVVGCELDSLGERAGSLGECAVSFAEKRLLEMHIDE